jgi:two-component system, NtrC family, response regulator AtoC
MGLPRQAQPIRVLVVDDDEDTRLALQDALQDQGYPTVDAATGEEGLQLLHHSPTPLVVLVDYLMAGDGEQFLRNVAAMDTLWQRHAFILISASSNRYTPETEALRTRLGVPSVGKPFDLEQLLDVVARAAEQLGQGHPPQRSDARRQR